MSEPMHAHICPCCKRLFRCSLQFHCIAQCNECLSDCQGADITGQPCSRVTTPDWKLVLFDVEGGIDGVDAGDKWKQGG